MLEQTKTVGDEAYTNLAHAIVRKAAEDFVEAKKRIKKAEHKLHLNPKDEDAKLSKICAEHEKKKIEKFFRSEWCCELCGNVSGEYILRELEKMDKMEKIKYGNV